jgi:hypothetical protein
VRQATPPAGRNVALKLDSYAWPGGYQMYYLTASSDALCPGCANCKEVRRADPDYCGDDQWNLIGAEINYEDINLYCAHCNKSIDPSCMNEAELEAARKAEGDADAS